MPDLILHHYAMSPFAEKVRAMMGYTGLSWSGVLHPPQPPRKKLVPLAGEYRKIPVAQIGADVFCDTRLITREIARLSGQPRLALAGCDDEVRAFVARTDLEVFLACVISASSPKLLFRFWRSTSTLTVIRFLRDRIQMGRTATVRAASPKRAPGVVKAHLEDLESRLANQPFLFGDTPCIADFSAWHGLWFIREAAGGNLTEPYARVNAWMDRMKAFGHGPNQPMKGKAAWAVARDATPRELPKSEDSPLLGKPVTVTPSDYGQVPVSGTLVAQLADSWVLAREHAATGTVHVHLPRDGFTLAPAQA